MSAVRETLGHKEALRRLRWYAGLLAAVFMVLAFGRWFDSTANPLSGVILFLAGIAAGHTSFRAHRDLWAMP